MKPIRGSLSAVGNSPWIPVDTYQDPMNITVTVEVASGDPTYSVVWTTDDVFNNANPTPFAGPANLTGATTTQSGAIGGPITGVQIQMTGGAGVINYALIQAGALG